MGHHCRARRWPLGRNRLGARLANRVSPEKLRVALVIVIAGMAAFMAFKAWA